MVTIIAMGTDTALMGVLLTFSAISITALLFRKGLEDSPEFKRLAESQ